MSETLTPAIEWVEGLKPIGEPGKEHSRLMGHVRILGVDFDVNAEQVVDVEEEDGIIQESVADVSFVDNIQDFCDGAGETVMINDKEYLLAITPYTV